MCFGSFSFLSMKISSWPVPARPTQKIKRHKKTRKKIRHHGQVISTQNQTCGRDEPKAGQNRQGFDPGCFSVQNFFCQKQYQQQNQRPEYCFGKSGYKRRHEPPGQSNVDRVQSQKPDPRHLVFSAFSGGDFVRCFDIQVRSTLFSLSRFCNAPTACSFSWGMLFNQRTSTLIFSSRVAGPASCLAEKYQIIRDLF